MFRTQTRRNMTGNISALLCCLLLSAAAQVCAAQDERTFPQWLSGLIGVSGFLLVAFVSFLVKKLWCESSDPSRGRSVDVELVQENVYVEDLDDLRSKKPANVNKRRSHEGNEESVYVTNLDDLRRRSSDKTDPTTDDVYTTNLDALRRRSSEKTDPTTDAVYATSLDDLRSQSSEEAEPTTDAVYATSLDDLRSQSSEDTDSSENGSTDGVYATTLEDRRRSHEQTEVVITTTYTTNVVDLRRRDSEERQVATDATDAARAIRPGLLRGRSYDDRDSPKYKVYEMSLDVLRSEDNRSSFTNVLSFKPEDSNSFM